MMLHEALEAIETRYGPSPGPHHSHSHSASAAVPPAIMPRPTNGEPVRSSSMGHIQPGSTPVAMYPPLDRSRIHNVLPPLVNPGLGGPGHYVSPYPVLPAQGYFGGHPFNPVANGPFHFGLNATY